MKAKKVIIKLQLGADIDFVVKNENMFGGRN